MATAPSNDVVVTLGSVLAGVRVAARLRQEDLAPKIDLTVDRISSIENDHSPCDVRIFKRWIEACGDDPSTVIRRVPVDE